MGVKSKNNEYSKKYQQMRADYYPGYSLYYLPEEHYIGMSKNVVARISKHKHLGKIIEGWEVIESFDNPVLCHYYETLFHLCGYNGYRP